MAITVDPTSSEGGNAGGEALELTERAHVDARLRRDPTLAAAAALPAPLAAPPWVWDSGRRPRRPCARACAAERVELLAFAGSRPSRSPRTERVGGAVGGERPRGGASRVASARRRVVVGPALELQAAPAQAMILTGEALAIRRHAGAAAWTTRALARCCAGGRRRVRAAEAGVERAVGAALNAAGDGAPRAACRADATQRSEHAGGGAAKIRSRGLRPDGAAGGGGRAHVAHGVTRRLLGHDAGYRAFQQSRGECVCRTVLR